ncbi:MAG: permease-like cell division protein FtsX [Actinomycetota bacterium]
MAGDGVRRWWSVAALVVAAMLVGACGLLGGDADDGSPALGSQSEPVNGTAEAGGFDVEDEISELWTAYSRCVEQPAPLPDGSFEVIVWLPVDAPGELVAAIDEALGSTAGVTIHRYVDRDETYARFVEFFADDGPDVIDLVEPEQLPTSFAVTVTDQVGFEEASNAVRAILPSADIELEIGSDPGCEAELTALRTACDAVDPRRLAIWLVVGVDQTAVGSVADLLEAEPLVTEHRYIDEEAMAEYLGSSGRVSANPQQLPTSFVFTLTESSTGDAAAVESLVERLSSQPGVDRVTRADNEPQDPEGIWRCTGAFTLDVS